MGLWIEQNLPALFVGAGLGAILGRWFLPDPGLWPIGALAGIGITLPVWQFINRQKPN